MRRHLLALLAVSSLLIASDPVRAEPTAIVEDARPEVPEAEFLALLEPGQVIELPPGGTLVLGYLRSCTRETITGGTVEIGHSESSVTGGSVDRDAASCPGGSRVAAPAQGRVMAGVSVRSVAGNNTAEPSPRSDTDDGDEAVLVRSLGPIVLLPTEGGQLEIRRMPSDGTTGRDPAVARVIASLHPPVATLAAETQLVDLGREKVLLEPGEAYLLVSGDRTLRIDVAPEADAILGPPLGRLVRF
jgi:hypothetical protein